MKKLFFFFVAQLMLGSALFAQVGINTDNSAPNSSAMLDVKSSDKGFLPPRMTFTEMNAVASPASGLMVYCTDCGPNGTGTLAMFINGMWFIFNANCLAPGAPSPGVHLPSAGQIVWNWNTVAWATGYKWNTTDDYNTATDMAAVTTKTETGLVCNTSYTRYVWAYNACGNSTAAPLTQTTSLVPPDAPTEGAHVPLSNQITWNWNTVTGATGYKWNTTDNYATATDMAAVTTKTETGLVCNTPYTRYVWSYNNCGNSTSTALDQSTTACGGFPVVTTTAASNIGLTTAISGGNVLSDGGNAVFVRGVCWNTSPSPTMANSYTTDGSGTGQFVSNLAGLANNTLYYVRSYAVNSAGTAYGNEISFVTLPTLTTNAVTSITQTTAISGGNITVGGGAPISARGVCWSTLTDPTIADSHTTDGTGTGAFTSALTGLDGNTFYYVKAYATNASGTSYGNQRTFTTSPVLATVTTDPAIYITLMTATSGGNVTSNGGGTVTARGVCWGTSPNPTTANSKTVDGSGTGAFVSALAGLTLNTPYYVRAYATNSAGTAYGNEITFTTLLNPILPTVTTAAITNNTTGTSATSGGTVLSDGGANVILRGVCYSTNPNPTIADSYTTDGSGTGTFVSALTGLAPNTIYYVRAYAMNSVGTAYGNELSFTTPIPCGSSIVINHVVSGGTAPVDKTVAYGTVSNIPGETSKCWITSNLGADHQATAVDDATEASAGWYWQFNRKQGYKHDGTTRTPNTTWISSINENLNWLPANDPCTIELGTGWRIPTQTEWANVDASGGWTNWNGPWNSLLKMHAAGYLHYSDGSLSTRGSNGNYWSSTQHGASYGWYLYFYSGSSNMNDYGKAGGFALRCVRDY